MLKWVGRLGLPLYLFLLVSGALQGGPPVATLPPSAAPLGALAAFTPLREWIVRGLLQLGRLGPLGVLAALAMPRREGFVARVLGMALPAAILSLAGAVVTGVVDGGRPWTLPGLFEMVGPGLAVLFGVWVGMTLTRGFGAALFFLPRLALYGVLLFAGAAVLAWRCLEPKPLGFEAAKLTAADERRLSGLLSDKSPMQLRDGQTAELQLTSHDVDLLMARGLSLGGPDRKARVDMDHGAATVQASLRVPRLDRYLNLVARGRAEVRDGLLDLHGDTLRIGGFDTPGWAVPPLAFLAERALNGDRRLRPALSPVRRFAIEEGGLRIVYGRARLPPGFVADLFRGGGIEAQAP